MTLGVDPQKLDLGRFVRPGDYIVWGQACGEPTILVEALGAQAPRLGGVSAFAATSFSGLLTAAFAEHVALWSMGAVGALRSVAKAGRLGIGALIGTRRLYDFADRNPALGLRASSYTHADAVLSTIPRLVTIHSAVEVDLSGQVNAEQAGEAHVGGAGGQVDYARGRPLARRTLDHRVPGPHAGRTLAERARRLVTIADPAYRAALDEAAHAIAKRGF